MELLTPLLESWNRQSSIVKAVAGLINEENCERTPSSDGRSLKFHLAHIHNVRYEWIGHLDEELQGSLSSAMEKDWVTPIEDLNQIKSYLNQSSTAVETAVRNAITAGRTKCGGYDHPVFFLQHMIWHEGWHIGLIFLGLRLAGQEPAMEWEEANVWGQWRTE